MSNIIFNSNSFAISSLLVVYTNELYFSQIMEMNKNN